MVKLWLKGGLPIDGVDIRDAAWLLWVKLYAGWLRKATDIKDNAIVRCLHPFPEQHKTKSTSKLVKTKYEYNLADWAVPGIWTENVESWHVCHSALISSFIRFCQWDFPKMKFCSFCAPAFWTLL